MRTSCIAAVVALVLAPAVGLACATCACGDPTLTSMGAEQPFTGRLRLATSLRAWGHTEGEEAVDATTLRELRMDVSVAYAPVPWLFLSALLPLQARSVRDVSLARETAWGVGDVELSAKAFVYRDRDFSPRHLFSVLAGVKLPTAPTQYAGRVPLSLDAQLGSGSVDPLLGVAYAHFRSEWSFLASATGYLPTRGREDFRAGASLRTTVAAQYQTSPRWALRLAADGRLASASDTRGVLDPVERGFVGFLSPDVLLSPVTDVVVQLGVRVPVVHLVHGPMRETPIVQAAVAYDL